MIDLISVCCRLSGEMAGAVKLFQFVQKCHQAYGIYPVQPNQRKHSTKFIVLMSYAQFSVTTAAFVLFKAKSMFDFGFVFFLLISITNAIAVYLIFIWQSQNTFEFIGNCEGFIEKSKYCLNVRTEFGRE